MGEETGLKGLFSRFSESKNVIATFPSDHDAFTAAEAFFDHWKSLPKCDGVLPHLRDYLDQPIPDLQPGVAIVDVLQDDTLNVRLIGTQRAALFGKDLTHQNPIVAFSDGAKADALNHSLLVVSQPCGHRSVQKILTSSGRPCRGATMALPLKVDASDRRCFIHFRKLIEDLDFDETAAEILSIDQVEWIDIGAGIPQ